MNKITLMFSKNEVIKHFAYLDELRLDKETNLLYEGAECLQARFHLSYGEAHEVLSTWMGSFDPYTSVQDRVERLFRL